MKTAITALALLALALGTAAPAAATACYYEQIVYVDPIKRDTGDPTLDGVVIDVGYWYCPPPPPPPHS